MKTQYINIEPTKDLNATLVRIDLEDFEIETGPKFIVTFISKDGLPIDRKSVGIPEQWKTWGESKGPESEENDVKYVRNSIKNNLQILETSPFIDPVTIVPDTKPVDIKPPKEIIPPTTEEIAAGKV